MSPQDLAGLATAAFNNRDSAGLLALWTEDLHVVAPDGEHHGAQAMLERELRLWRAFPDIQSSIRTISVSGQSLAQETTLTGTHTGPFVAGGQEFAPTGKSVTWTIAVHVWFRDGRVCREHVYYDRLGVFRQLGLM